MFKSDYAENLFNVLTMMVGKNQSINYLPLQLEVDKKLEFMQEDFESLSFDQAVAINEIILGESNVITICGKAGVGKTYLVRTLKSIFENLFQCNLIVVASTGIASQNCEGSGTLHSVFGVGLGNKLPWDWVEEVPDNRYPRNNALKVAGRLPAFSPLATLDKKLPTVVIVDEISMISSELLNVVYQIALYRHGAEQSVTAAARSIKFVCFGDTMQLLPIPNKSKWSREITNYPWHRAQYKLDSEGTIETIPSLLKEGCFKGFNSKRYALITNHRQKSQRDFVNALNYIRAGGNIDEGPARVLLSRIFKDQQKLPRGYDVIHTYYTNNETRKKNKEVVESLPEEKRKIYKARVAYQNPYKKQSKVIKGEIVKEEESKVNGKKRPQLVVNDSTGEARIDKKWIPEWAMPIQELGIGLPFMIRQNMPSQGLYNGTVGVITQFVKDNAIKIRLDHDGTEVTVKEEQCNGVSVDKNGKPVGDYISLPGHVCSAMTVNKSQGLTINKPLVVHIKPKASKNIPPHWVYVALSRVSEIENLYIDSDVSTINEAIKIESSALEFTEEAERNISEFTNGKILGDTITPEQVRRKEPVIIDVKKKNSEQFNFYLKVYVERDYEQDIKAIVNPNTLEVTYIDLDDNEELSPKEWAKHTLAIAKIKEYLHSTGEYEENNLEGQAQAA